MQRCCTIGMCLILVIAFSTFGAVDCGIAGEPLPNASMVAYRSHPPPPAKLSEVTLTGTILAAAPNGLTIKASKTNRARNQKQWFVVLSQSGSAEVTIHGTATPDYLRHGQIVEFNGQIVEKEKVAEKVNELTIVAYQRGSSPFNRAGAKDRAAAPGVGGRLEASKPEADPEILALADDAKAGDGDRPKASAGVPMTKIVGRIASYDKTGLTLTSGPRTIHAELAEVPTIHVEIFNPKVVQNGSKVEIQGAGASGHMVSLTPNDLTGARIVVHGAGAESRSGSECVARTVEITLARPLTGKRPASSGTKKALDAKPTHV